MTTPHALYTIGLYTIGKLAQATDVTPRTIRYYTAEGLLPPPDSSQKVALYSEAHRSRLRLIQMLKSAFLPLAAIRTHLAALSDAEVESLVAAFTKERAEPMQAENGRGKLRLRVETPEPQAQQSSLDYVRQVLAVVGQSAPALASETDAPEKKRRALLVSPVAPASEAPRLVPASRQLWERIELAPGVELHVSLPDDPAERTRLINLIEQTCALFDAPEG